MKLALFKNVKHDFTAVCNDKFNSDDYIRISEFTDVDFKMMLDEDIVVNEIAALNAAKKEIQAQTDFKLMVIDQRIGELPALPHFE